MYSMVMKISEILFSLADDLSLDLFENLNKANGLTRKKYYTRMNRFKDQGLVKKVNGGVTHYELTAAGLIVQYVIDILRKVQENKPYLTAYEILRSHDQLKAGRVLIKDQQLLEILDYYFTNGQVPNPSIRNKVIADKY